MELIKDRKALVKSIASIKARGKRLDKDIHTALCSAVWHRQEHGDNTLIAEVINAMPKGSRANAAIQWAVTFGGVDYNGKDKNKGVKFKNNEADILLDDAILTPFWEMKGQKEGEDFNPEKDLKAVIGILTRHAEKAEEAGEQLVAATYRTMADQLSNLNSGKEEKKAA